MTFCLRGLYAIVDVEALAARGLDVQRFASAILAAKPAALQLRDKRRDARATLESLRALASITRAAKVPLFANDRPDLALLAGCDGVHVGQDDAPPDVVRRLTFTGRDEPLRIGLSTHALADVERALSDPTNELDYLAIGPIFSTQSKENPSPVLGLEGGAAMAAAARAARPGLPIVAIGGIDLARAAEVAAFADAVAVIGALVPPADAADPYAEARGRAEQLVAALDTVYAIG